MLLACGTTPSDPAPATSAAPAEAAPPPPLTTPPASTTPPPPPANDAGSPPACATSTLKPGDTTQTITVGGLARTYSVHVPPSYTGKTPVPVVLDFHPLSVNAGLWKLATGWSGVADDKGFLLVVPQGYMDSWNVGRCCSPAHDANVDDVAFVRALVKELEAHACVDAKRIYATGCSNGGGMTYKLACDAADLVAAGAPVDFDCITGPTSSPSCGACSPSRPMSITQFRGTNDGSVPYDGGPTKVVAGLEFPGAKNNFADWAARNMCTGSSHAEPAHPTCDTYTTCAGGADTTLCTVPLGQHCTSYVPFGIASIAWESLATHSLP